MTKATKKVSFRLDSLVHATAETIAREQSVSTEALFQRIVTHHVTEHAKKEGLMTPEDIDRLQRKQNLLAAAVRRARELDEGPAHSTSTLR